MFLISPTAFRAGTSLINELSNLGQLTNLKVCLDAGDPNSYPGTGQTWSDLSGNGNHFYRGTGSGSDGADPTWVGNGEGGTYREYFTFDGGDYFTKAAANPAWLQTFHKSGAKFTIGLWVYTGDLVSANKNVGVIGDSTRSDGFSYVGFQFGVTSNAPAGHAFLFITNGSGTSYAKTTTAVLSGNAWSFMAVSADFVAGNVIFQMNATTESYSSQSLASPSSASAESTLQVGAVGAGQAPESSSSRIACGFIMDAALTGAQLASNYAAEKGRFGL